MTPEIEALLREAARELRHAAFVAYLPDGAAAFRALSDRIRDTLVALSNPK